MRNMPLKKLGLNMGPFAYQATALAPGLLFSSYSPFIILFADAAIFLSSGAYDLLGSGRV